MGDFSTNASESIKLFEQTVRAEYNFDILQRQVIIGGHKAGFFFIDGFVQEDMVEKLMQFFYSLKEEDMTDIDTFLENGMPYTEVEKSDQIKDVVKKFLSGVTVLFIDGYSECL